MVMMLFQYSHLSLLGPLIWSRARPARRRDSANRFSQFRRLARVRPVLTLGLV